MNVMRDSASEEVNLQLLDRSHVYSSCELRFV